MHDIKAVSAKQLDQLAIESDLEPEFKKHLSDTLLNLVINGQQATAVELTTAKTSNFNLPSKQRPMSVTTVTPIYNEATAANFAKGIEPSVTIHKGTEIKTAPLTFGKQFDLVATVCSNTDEQLEFTSKDFSKEALVVKHIYLKAGDKVFKAELPIAPLLRFKSKHQIGPILSFDVPDQAMYINVGPRDDERVLSLQMHVLGYFNPETGQILLEAASKVSSLNQAPDSLDVYMEGHPFVPVGFDLHIVPFSSAN